MTRIAAILFSVLALTAMAPAQAQLGDLLDQAKEMGGDSLSSMLAGSLGTDTDAVEGGLGGLFELAKNQLSGDDYAKVLEAIPGVSGYVDKARSMGLLDLPLNSAEGLTSALGKVGMDPETVQRFLPAAVDAIGAVGGEPIRQMLLPLVGG